MVGNFIHSNILFWTWMISIVSFLLLDVAYVFFSVILLYKHRSLSVLYGVGSAIGIIYFCCMLNMWVLPTFGESAVQVGLVLLIFCIVNLVVWLMCSFCEGEIAEEWVEWFKRRGKQITYNRR